MFNYWSILVGIVGLKIKDDPAFKEPPNSVGKKSFYDILEAL